MNSKGFDTGSVSGNLDNYYNSACGSNGAGFLISHDSSAASNTTCWPDYGYASYYSSYAFFSSVGGFYNDGARAGLFFARVYYSSASSSGYFCARLSFRG